MLEKKIAETISSNTPMKEKNQRIQRIKGLGKICAATLLAHIPESFPARRSRRWPDWLPITGIVEPHANAATYMEAASGCGHASTWLRSAQSSTTP